MHEHEASKTTLAECPGLGRIHMCSCHAIHLSIGPMMINLEPEAFQQLTAMMNRANAELTRGKSLEDHGNMQQLHKAPTGRFLN